LAFWVTLVRGIFAISLGVALVFNSDMARPILGNFLGVYWISAGIISMRWNAAGERGGKLSLLTGLIGILAGLAVLTRTLTSSILDEYWVIATLGVVVMLTGFLHIFMGFRTRDGERHRRWTSTLLGVFEVLLGAILFLEPMERGPILQIAAMGWALLGGSILMLDAFRVRRRIRAEKETEISN
jgi:uncharacterized membrane protein HdeD (DUF308 family)